MKHTAMFDSGII